VATRAHRLLSRAEKVHLRHLVEELERETGAEIATLIMPHVADLESYATAVFNHFGIGKREHDNGILVLVVVDRRLVRVEVGRGLEHVVTHEAASEIIDEAMIPQFRVGRYGDGLIMGVEAFARLIKEAHVQAGGTR